MIFAAHKLHKATNEKVLIMSLYVNSCSPEGVTKLSTLYALDIIDAFICYKQKCKVAPFNLAHPVQSEDTNGDVADETQDDEVIISSRQFTETRSSTTETSRRLQGSSVYSEMSAVGSGGLMSERVVRAPQHCGSVQSLVIISIIVINSTFTFSRRR